MNPLTHRIEPFRALLFDPSVSGDLSRVIAPPYDLIGPALQDELYGRSPYNVVRLELARDSDRYSSAAATLTDWLGCGAVKRTSAAAIYLYTQQFTVRSGGSFTRSSLVVRLRLEPFGHGSIMPHERTFPAPKEDRLRLLAATQTNISPVFGLYRGSYPELDALRERLCRQSPVADVVDDLEVKNRLWHVGDPRDIGLVQTALAEAPILIADGHHRYETALEYARRRRAPNWEQRGLESFDYIMAALVACDDPGLVILPTHRVVTRPFDAEALNAFTRNAAEFFEIEEFAAADKPAFLGRLLRLGKGTLGVALRGVASRMILRGARPGAAASLLAHIPAAVRELDVSILHGLVFERLLKLPADEVSAGHAVQYTTDADGALEQVASGEAAGAFLVNPPSIAEVESAAQAGATMPEKSTYFYPKLTTGLVMNPLFE